MSASIFVFQPKSVTLEELQELRAQDANAKPASPSKSTTLLVGSAPSMPEHPCPFCPHLAKQFELVRQASDWKSMHQRAKDREKQLQHQLQAAHPRIRDLEHRNYGKSSETTAKPDVFAEEREAKNTPNEPKPKGQRKGRKGPKRRDYLHLPSTIEIKDLP